MYSHVFKSPSKILWNHQPDIFHTKPKHLIYTEYRIHVIKIYQNLMNTFFQKNRLPVCEKTPVQPRNLGLENFAGGNVTDFPFESVWCHVCSMDMSFRAGPEKRSLSTSTGEPELFAHMKYTNNSTREESYVCWRLGLKCQCANIIRWCVTPRNCSF